MRIPVTARLDFPGRTFSWKDLKANTVSQPLWYQVTMFVDPNTSVESFIQKVKNYWSTVKYIENAKLIDRPTILRKNTTLHFIG